MAQNAQKFWDKQAKRYDRGERQFDPVYKEIIAKTSKYLDLNDLALDFGCATGTKTFELANKVRQIHGLDFSAEMIHEANKKKDGSNLSNISFSQGTIFDTDLGKASFDKIISYGVIHLLEDDEKVIRRIHELLKPGGLFISTTACLKDKMAVKNRLEFRTYLFMKRLGLFPLHLNMYMPGDVDKLIKDQEFQILESERIFHGITAYFIVARK